MLWDVQRPTGCCIKQKNLYGRCSYLACIAHSKNTHYFATISSESSEKFVTQIYLKLFRHSKILSSLSATAAKFMGVKRIKIAITHVNCELRQGSWQEHGQFLRTMPVEMWQHWCLIRLIDYTWEFYMSYRRSSWQIIHVWLQRSGKYQFPF